MRKLWGIAAVLALAGMAALAAAGCGAGGPVGGGGGDGGSLTGAGATFPYPLYSKWFDVYDQQNPGVNINYQSIGSGAGIQQIIAQTVDFGASDAPMTDQQLAGAPAEILHIPTVAGAVVVTYNLEGVATGLKISPDVLAQIYLGAITKWNDQAIAAENPGVSLPDRDIVVVHRSDGSGTTNIFTSYLSAVSPEWSSQVGKGTEVKWPAGVGGKGNEGVTGQVTQAPGSIGYVELAYAEQNKLPVASIKNKAGNFIAPTLDSTNAAIQGAAGSLPADFRGSIGNPDGANAYPIAGFTYLLVYRNQANQAKGQTLVNFLWWAVHDGQQYAAGLDYVALPPALVSRVEDQIRKINYNGQSLAP